MHKINLLCPTIYRQHRKIGRNEPCPCGRTREVTGVEPDQIKHATFTLVPRHMADGTVKSTTVMSVPVKFKHCCGDIDNQTKARRVQAAIKAHFESLIRPAKECSKLRALAGNIKKVFGVAKSMNPFKSWKKGK